GTAPAAQIRSRPLCLPSGPAVRGAAQVDRSEPAGERATQPGAGVARFRVEHDRRPAGRTPAPRLLLGNTPGRLAALRLVGAAIGDEHEQRLAAVARARR